MSFYKQVDQKDKDVLSMRSVKYILRGVYLLTRFYQFQIDVLRSNCV
jgi:hypothetical protein